MFSKLIESEARSRWSVDSACSSQMEQDLQNEVGTKFDITYASRVIVWYAHLQVKELRKTIEQHKEDIQEEKSSNERLTKNMEALQEELHRARKIIACSSSDDKSVIGMRLKLFPVMK